MTIPQNPYIGPRPFKQNEALYGRNRETHQLKALLIAERIVLFHSPSGAGKTSLIQAGLIPGLLENHFHVFPVIRVNHNLQNLLIPDGLRDGNFNRYLLSTLLSLEEPIPEKHRIPLGKLVELDLDSYLNLRYSFKEEPVSKVLIFDQFEEVLTLSLTDHTKKTAFFTQLGATLYNPNLWALFSMREDYVPVLSPYLHLIPNRLNCTFRLDLLGIDSARQAIQEPVRAIGNDFSDAAAQKLVDDLRVIKVQQSDGTMQTELGLSIEPVQLQVVCYRLWEKKSKDKETIDLEDLDTVGYVNQSLSAYYQNSLENVIERTGVKERHLREWFEKKLISPGKIRSQIMMGKTESDGLSNDAIKLLIDAHLVRGEKRAGVNWFELVHDRFIEPIQKNNAEWFSKNLVLLQVQAALWDSQNRPERLLIRDNDLEQVDDWASKNKEEITPIESQYLAECKRVIQHEQEIRKLELRAEALQEKRRKDKDESRRRLLIGLIIGLLITIGLALSAFIQRQKALDRLLLARIESIDLRESKMQILKLGLSIEAFHHLQDAESYKSIWSSKNMFRPDDLRNRVGDPVKSICFSADSQFLVSETDKNLVQVWDSSNGSHLLKIYPISNNIVANDLKVKVLCSPDGRIITKERGDKSSKILIWNLKTGANLLTLNLDDVISDFAISPNGKNIVSGSKDGHIVLWDAYTGEVKDSILDDNSIETILFSPNGEQIASANTNGDVLVWNITKKRIVRISTETSELYLTFSPDNRWLVSGGKDGNVIFWNPINGEKQRTIYLNESITVLVFSPDGKRLYTASQDGAYKIWDTTKHIFYEVVDSSYYGPIHDANFSPNSEYFVHGGMSGYIQAYEFGKIDRTGRPKAAYDIATTFGEGEVNQAIFSPDGRKFAAAIDSGEIIVSPMTTNVVYHDSKVWDIEFSKKKSLIVTSSMDNTARVWKSTTGQKVLELIHNDQVNSATFNPGDDLIATASSDHTAKIWRLLDGKEIFSLNHNDSVVDVKFSSDGKFVASAGWDGIAQVWQIYDQTKMFFISHNKRINHVLFSPNDKWVISASDDHSIQVWDLRNRAKVYDLSHNYPVIDVEITYDSNYIISGDEGGNVVVWSTKLGQRVFEANMGSSSVLKVAVSPDNNFIAAGNEVGDVCVWEITKGENSFCFYTKQAIWDVIFSESDYVFAGSLDGYVYIWDLNSKEEYLRIANPGKVLSLDISPENKFVAIATTSGRASFVQWKKEDILPEACLILPRNLSKEEWKEFLGGELYDPFCDSH